MNKKFSLAVAMLLICLGLFVVACAPRQASDAPQSNEASDGASAVQMPVWSVDSDCASCHSTEADSATNASAGYSYHVNQPGMKCINCHTDDDGALSGVHKGEYATAKPPKSLKKTEVSSKGCLASGCHDKEEIKTLTAGLTLLTDTKGTTVNPHDLTPSKDHDLVICASCHEQHSGTKVEELAPETCLTCHHKGSYECGTCH